ncbi:hypothetical protein OSB04_021914 [Centaurea solstitialis]|uniref:Uncharacterized protein n=1 Tax=Centaurea solstitialis TaxID=347529 RepID=A0AA38T6D8_9ASTR|nr:hypothetical protein OSB04_021914 [Centaurea solstitialis]
MGSKKRSSDSVVEEVDNHKSNTISATENHQKKKIKKVKKNDGEEIAANGNNDASVKPMERKKKRKALDKEKHHRSSLDDDDNGEVKPKMVELEVKEVVENSSRSVNSLPEFHIGVFKDLGSADVSVREAGAERLGMELQEVQKAYNMLEKKEDVEGGLKLDAEKDDGLNNCAPSVRYAIRGLFVVFHPQERCCARQGFALGLTLLVGTVPDIALSSLLKLIVDLLEVSSSMKGQEIKDCLLGRLFAYGSLARSGRLIQESVSDESSELIKDFTSSVISLASKKRYLQEPAVVVILQLVEKLPVEVVLKQVLEAPGLQEWFEGATEAGNPDALLLALKLREKYLLTTKSLASSCLIHIVPA